MAGLFFKLNTHRLTELEFWYDILLSRWQPWRHCNSGWMLQAS